MLSFTSLLQGHSSTQCSLQVKDFPSTYTAVLFHTISETYFNKHGGSSCRQSTQNLSNIITYGLYCFCRWQGRKFLHVKYENKREKKVYTITHVTSTKTRKTTAHYITTFKLLSPMVGQSRFTRRSFFRTHLKFYKHDILKMIYKN
jgi:hypothetical protein